MFQALGSSTLVFTLAPVAPTATPIPGLSLNINVPSSSFVQVQTDGGIRCLTGPASAPVLIDISLFVDGAAAKVRRVAVNCSTTVGEATWSFSALLQLSAGQHTFGVEAAFVSPLNAVVDVSGGSSDPQHQGELDATIIKQ